MKRRIVIREDRVQDVGYRLFLLEVAEQLGITGFQARNVGDRVECVVEGDEERVRSFLEFVRSNYPEFASVREVIDGEYEGNVMSVEGFYRLFSLQQLVKIVNAGLGMLEKQDGMLEKQDRLLEKQDRMLEKQEKMLEMREKMLEKQDDTIREIKALRYDLKAWMEDRFSKIEREIAEIKARIGMS